MKIETGKSLLLFLILFVAWQLLYFLGFDELLNYTIVLLVAIGFFALDKQTLASLGLRRSAHWGRYVNIGVVLGTGFVACLSALGWATHRNDPIDLTRPYISILNLGLFSVPYVAVLALFIGLVEESSFRGYILRNLLATSTPRRALFYSAVLFMLYHVSFFFLYNSPFPASETFTYWSSFLLYAFVVGIVIGYFYMNAKQTITGTVAFHSSIIFVESFLPYEGTLQFAEGHLEVTVVILLFLPLLVLLKRAGWLG